MIRLTYQKKNGDIIQKYINVYTQYGIGETNSYGWKVLNKEYLHKGNYYSYSEYSNLLDKECKKSLNIMKFKNTIYRVYKELVYCILLLMFIKIFEIINNVNI